MRTIKATALFFLLPLLLGNSSSSTPSYNWPVHDPFTIINTISTLQFYGPTPGFHHGLDIHAAAGTPVYAPVGGSVGMGYYYPRAQVPFTYEVFIDGDDGNRWEFHHIDQATIPKEVADLANRHGRIEVGTLLGRIYDASKMNPSMPPHVHVDMIGRDGVYQNSLKVFPPLTNKTAPAVQGIYVVGADDRVVAAKTAQVESVVPIPAGKYELVLDIIDIFDGAPMGDAVSRLSVVANGIAIGGQDFSERLPQKNYLEGVSQVYKISPILLPDGKTLTNQVEQSSPRKFLYRFDLDTSKIARGADDVILVQISAQSFSGNKAQASFGLKLQAP